MLSLYIPIISESVSEVYITKTFIANNIGKISRIDFVKNKSKNRREAFIHFEEWFDNEESKKLKDDVLNPESKTRFKYSKNNNKFWPLLVNKNPDKKVENPNYEILKKEDLKISYKDKLNINNNKKDTNNTKNQRIKK